jgi:hypothetical protein
VLPLLVLLLGRARLLVLVLLAPLQVQQGEVLVVVLLLGLLLGQQQ